MRTLVTLWDIKNCKLKFFSKIKSQMRRFFDWMQNASIEILCCHPSIFYQGLFCSLDLSFDPWTLFLFDYSLFVAASAIETLTTFAFVIGHCANATVFTVDSTSLILAIGAAETMRTRAHVVTDTYSTVGALRCASIWKVFELFNTRGI